MSYYFSVIPVFFPCAYVFTGGSCQTKRDIHADDTVEVHSYVCKFSNMTFILDYI
jgi:hypothetical protein